MTTSAAEPARRPREASSGRRGSMVLVGLAVVSRLAHDARTYETAIVIVIAVVAVAGLGRASRANSWARLAAWDKRRRRSTGRPTVAAAAAASDIERALIVSTCPNPSSQGASRNGRARAEFLKLEA